MPQQWPRYHCPEAPLETEQSQWARPQHSPNSQRTWRLSTPWPSTSWRPSTSMPWSWCHKDQLEVAEDDVWGWRQADPPDSDQQGDHCPRASEDPWRSTWHHSDYHKVWRQCLALLRWAPHRCAPANQWRHPCPLSTNASSPMMRQGRYDPPVCSEVPWGSGLDLAQRQVPAHLQGPAAAPHTGKLPKLSSTSLNGQRTGRLSTPGPLTSWRPSTSMPKKLIPQRPAGSS